MGSARYAGKVLTAPQQAVQERRNSVGAGEADPVVRRRVGWGAADGHNNGVERGKVVRGHDVRRGERDRLGAQLAEPAGQLFAVSGRTCVEDAQAEQGQRFEYAG